MAGHKDEKPWRPLQGAHTPAWFPCGPGPGATRLRTCCCSKFLTLRLSHACSPKRLALDKNIGEGNGTPLQHPCLENSMGGGAWWAAVHGVAKSRTRLSDFTLTFHFHALEKEMATHSSVLAWRFPGTGKPGGLPSLGSHRVGHD